MSARSRVASDPSNLWWVTKMSDPCSSKRTTGKGVQMSGSEGLFREDCSPWEVPTTAQIAKRGSAASPSFKVFRIQPNSSWSKPIADPAVSRSLDQRLPKSPSSLRYTVSLLNKQVSFQSIKYPEVQEKFHKLNQ